MAAGKKKVHEHFIYGFTEGSRTLMFGAVYLQVLHILPADSLYPPVRAVLIRDQIMCDFRARNLLKNFYLINYKL